MNVRENSIDLGALSGGRADAASGRPAHAVSRVRADSATDRGRPDTSRSAERVPAAGRLLLAMLERLSVGDLEVVTPAGARHRFGPGEAPRAQLRLRDWSVAHELLSGGDNAFAEAWIDGRWDTPDLVALLTLAAANQDALERAFYGSRWRQALFRLRHLLRANTRRGSRRNILAHYDLGNDFYRLWLDPGMTYSSALFEGEPSRTLEQAQHAKYARILRELEPGPGDHVLEVGCGWGGFAELAARSTGCRVTGISLSEAQTAWARERIARAGLEDRVRLEIRDYRDLDGRFDAVASIEMFEAVGERWWPAYFQALHRALVPGGRAVVQAITIAEEKFERYRTTSDFIQQHVFPGGMLASPARLKAEAARAGLALVRERTFGADYAETLVRWLAAFDARRGEVLAQRFDERFVRLWRFYLAYCAAGFLTESTDVGQYTFVRR